ncbi:hypothetical protein GIY30_16780 [Gordonia sp. HNM0687]|uniref:Uncharacterized protein n=1 Tax=Gordonia mangrovi TaxID=2665643 RepID=A0A6L7GSL6_9ACTN|nr:hypothetical protein [Gordonia mangrovi]MXP22994.1 hypothetical protein [Gordonia mangrovi]UVF77287.1 hypothetical protein NWF22_18595 [Gordonia mangrovi]
MITTQPTVRRLRGCVVGAASGGSAIVAHTAAHGSLPGSSALTFLVGVCAALGWLVSAWRNSGAGGLGVLTGILAGGQVAAHLALAALAGGHGMMLSPQMGAAHSVAAVLTAAVCRALESALTVLLTALTRVIRVMLSVPVVPRPTWAVRTSYGIDHRTEITAARTCGTRGPPCRRRTSHLTPA